MGLKLNRSKSTSRSTETEALRRIASLPTHELTPWVEQSLYRIGKDLVDYGHAAEPALILDALKEAELMTELLQEIRRRVAP